MKIFYALVLITVSAHAGTELDPALGIKKGIEVKPIPYRYLENPNSRALPKEVSTELYYKIIDTLFKSGKVNLISSLEKNSKPTVNSFAAMALPDPCLREVSPKVSATIALDIDEAYFAIGAGPLRQVWGFLKGNENLFNSGKIIHLRNEFFGDKNFGNTFIDYGNLHTGLELAHEVNFDLMLAGLKIKKVPYISSLGAQIEIENQVSEIFQKERLQSSASGYAFDAAAHYLYYGSDFELAIGLAREDVYRRAVAQMIANISASILKRAEGVPLVVELVGACGDLHLIEGGENYNFKRGIRFYNKSQLDKGISPEVIEIDSVFNRTSSYIVTQSSLGVSKPGDLYVSLKRGEIVPKASLMNLQSFASRSLASLPNSNTEKTASVFDIPVLGSLVSAFSGFIQKVFSTVENIFTLPERIYRYGQYNKEFKATRYPNLPVQLMLTRAGHSWNDQAIALKAGVEKIRSLFPSEKKESAFGSGKIKIALIDTGVDYNHDELASHIDLQNQGGRLVSGWDFFSMDSRPFDDHAHGTAMASLITGVGKRVLGVAPHAILIPIKAFSPVGETSSSAIYSSFEYAIKRGAKIIVVGWATRTDTKVIRACMMIAKQAGVLVVAAAGDRGSNIDFIPEYPAALSRDYDNLLSVTSHDYKYTLAIPRSKAEVDSGFFPANFGSLVQMAAPGANIRVAEPRGNYSVRSHTGLAAAQVAGAAALLWNYCETKNIDVSYLQIKQALLDGASQKESLKNQVKQNKILNLPGAVNAVQKFCY